MKKEIFILCVFLSFGFTNLYGQIQTIGSGDNSGVTVTTSSASNQTSGDNTLTSQGFLPNLNSASRFLSQASFGGSYEDIEEVAEVGIEDWIDQQFSIPISFPVMDKIIEYKTIKNNALMDPNDNGAYNYYFDFGWWQYVMSSEDELRQRMALALSEILVISTFSGFGDNAYAFGSYWDMLAENAFGNYRDLLEDVTYHVAMGEYLTYMNNPKSNLSEGIFPDENYAREVMQLFSIGLYELNKNGTPKLNNGNLIPTYDNADIAEFSKIFTGLTHQNPYCEFGCGAMDYEETYLSRMQMNNEYHEPGVKNLLNGFQVPNRNPVDGDADIADALDNLFNHPNVGPFLGKFLIQRLVTSNPSGAYVRRVTDAFNGDGPHGTTRGDMKSVIKAILLDEEARSCFSADNRNFGMLREPFNRYLQLCKSFDLNTPSGEYRNAVYNVYNFVGQKPFYSPSVFNFFQSDFQPIGPIENANKVAPEFQITNTQSITGYFNVLNEWLMKDQHSDEWSIYGEDYESYSDQHAEFDFSDELDMARNTELTPQLLDRLNMILAHGKLTQPTLDAIATAMEEFETGGRNCDAECEGDPDCLMYCNSDNESADQARVRIAIYLVMASPEYLINR
jgi:uncharacterized protein (DUF1800 family)